MSGAVDAAPVRRSGRTTKPVERYADLDLEFPQKSHPAKKRKRASTVEPTDSTTIDDDVETKPKLAAKPKTQSKKAPAPKAAKSKSKSKAKASKSKTEINDSPMQASSSKATATLDTEAALLKEHHGNVPDKFKKKMYRAVKQRMVVVDRVRNDGISENVDLAGTTGNIYNVEITHASTCTCMDFRVRGKREGACKHILYVLSKVLKVHESLVYQAFFNTEELYEIFQNAGPLPTEIRSAVEDKDGKRKEIEGDCPICCEEMEPEGEAIVYCQAACGNNLHDSCFQRWAATKPYGVTCPYCRTPWQDLSVREGTITGISKDGIKNAEGYVNIASDLGMTGKRDTSIYYQQRKEAKKNASG